MRCRVIVVGLLLLLANFSTGQNAKKWPIPTKEAQAAKVLLIEEIYPKELAQAQKDPVAGARLAQDLLSEGRLTKDDIAGRYVLFAKAHSLAAQAGDVNTALAAADELARDFLIAPKAIFEMKIKMLQQASKANGAPPDAYQAVIDRVAVILEETLDADDYPSSLDLIAAAEQAAVKLKSVPLVVALRKRHAEIVRQSKEFARWQPFADKLAKNPKDEKANLEMGTYHALIKGNWDRGLPMLARGGKSNLQKIAAGDLSEKISPLSKGDDLASFRHQDRRRRHENAKALRAYHWYQESYPTADDKAKTFIDKQVAEIAAILPAEYRIGEIKSELKKIDAFGPVYGCSFSPDGKRFITTGYDNTLRLYSTQTFKEIRQLEGHAGKVFCVAFSADGQRAVSGGFDGTVRLWDLSTGQAKTFEGHKDYVRSVAISADGKWLLSGGDDRTVRLWNVATGKEERTLPGHDHTVWCIAISRDGKRALSASLDKTVRYWDLEKGETIKKLDGHKDTVLCVAFSPDDKHAVSGSTDKTLRLWDLNTGKTTMTFDASSGGYLQSVAISPDGRRILSAGSDANVRLWDAQTGKEIRKLEGHRDQVWHVAFSRDGRLAISSGQDASVRLWK